MSELQEVKVYLSNDGSETLYSDKTIMSPADAVNVMSELLGKQDREFLCVVNLDIKNRPINYHVVTIGTLTQSLVDVGNIFKTALLSNAPKVMVFHNHPSGDLIPSQEDITVTKKIIQAGNILGVQVLDHVIVGGRNNNYFSLYKSDPSLFSSGQKEVFESTLSVNEATQSEKYSALSKKEEFRKAVAEQFVRLLDPDNETDEMEWIKEWNGSSLLPENTLTGNRYRGINRICLFLTAAERGYKDPRWATLKSIKKIPGARVKKGEHGTKVEYWFVRDFGVDKDDPNYGKSYTFTQAAEMVKTNGRSWADFIPYPRYYTTFNAEQCTGIPPFVQKENHTVTQDSLVSKISESMGVSILNDGGDRAYYRPSEDTVHLPEKTAFVSTYAYNATAMHELAHATGAKDRLDRDLSGLFGSEDYASEELVAEIASCLGSINFVSDDAGIDEYLKEHAENHKRYVKSWAKAITSNPNCLVQAIKQAEIAADFMELHGGLIDVNTFNKHHGHDVTVFKDKDNQIKVCALKTPAYRKEIAVDNFEYQQENRQEQSCHL